MADLTVVFSDTTPPTPEPNDAAASWRDMLDAIEFVMSRFEGAVEDVVNTADELADDSDAPEDLRAAAEDVSSAATEAECEVRRCLDILRETVTEASNDADETAGRQS